MDIQIGDLSAQIVQAMKEYTEDVSEAIEQEVEERSKELLKAIKATSPVNTGDYKKGWRRKKEMVNGRLVYRIYNKEKPSLVHLLELGHAKRGGGRVAGKPHVRPATDREKKLLEQNIKSIIQRGG